MSAKITKKKLEEALETYANLVDIYPDNESYLKRYAEMLQTLDREATATAILQRLHGLIEKRSEEEARTFATSHPQIGKIDLDDIMFEGRDKHAVAGEIIIELLGKIWLTLHRKKLSEGQVVCRSNDLSDSIMIVIEGKVDAYDVINETTRTLIESIGSLDTLGEDTFFKPSKLNIDAFVSSDKAYIVKVPRKKLMEMVEENSYLKSMLSQRSLFRTNIHAIARSEPFRTLPLKLTKYLARSLTLRKYKAGSLIYALGQPLEGVGIILAGQACHLAKNSTGERLMLPPLEITSLIGDFTLKGKKAVSDTELMAKADVTIAHIPYADLLNVSVAFSPLKDRLNEHASVQQAQMMQWLTQGNHA